MFLKKLLLAVGLLFVSGAAASFAHAQDHLYSGMTYQLGGVVYGGAYGNRIRLPNTWPVFPPTYIQAFGKTACEENLLKAMDKVEAQMSRVCSCVARVAGGRASFGKYSDMSCEKSVCALDAERAGIRVGCMAKCEITEARSDPESVWHALVDHLRTIDAEFGTEEMWRELNNAC